MRGGFTLVELLVVIGIISLLASIILVATQTARSRGIDSKYAQEADNLRQAILLYRSNHNETLPACTADAPFPNWPYHCYDSAGSPYLDSTLAPLVTENDISKIPHYAGWPNTGAAWAVTDYLPNIYNYNGDPATEFSCDPVTYSNWTVGSLPGIMVIISNENLPLRKMSYTACDSNTGQCTLVPINGTGSINGINYYCFSLAY